MSEPIDIPTTLKRAVPLLIVGWLAVAASFAFPLPRPLDGLEARVAFWWSESGKYGLPFLIVATVWFLGTRPGAEGRRGREAVVMCGALMLVIGVVAIANEFGLKRRLQVPRPNIVRLAAAGELGGRTAEEFYALGDKQTRRDFLREHLPERPLGGPALPHLVREHWIEETGYSFPSGHSTAAMTFTAYFLALGLALLSGRRRAAMLLVVPWGVGVCWSRPLLGVHSPTDVTVGALQGALLGLIGFGLTTHALRRWGDDAPEPTTPS